MPVICIVIYNRDTNRYYRLYDFSKSVFIKPGKLYCISGKVNSVDKIYLVIDSVNEDKKNTLQICNQIMGGKKLFLTLSF